VHGKGGNVAEIIVISEVRKGNAGLEALAGEGWYRLKVRG
jgi:hypothetical protein